MQPEASVEEIWIFKQNVGLVTPLRVFDRGGNRPAVAEEIAIRIGDAHDRAFIGAVADRQAELLRLRFLDIDIEPELVAVYRRRD